MQEGSQVCANCGKALQLCVCEGISPIANKIRVLILQHPQEQDIDLGTARLATLFLRKSSLKIGLSWPNLAKALGYPADPKKWAVLYLGSANAAAHAPGKAIVFVDKKGFPLKDQEAFDDLEGLAVLDGTWSQAKAIWWRNPWLLKCRRIILGPSRPSRYGLLRKEPRRDGLSTIEAIALTLSYLENNSEIEKVLVQGFERLLTKYKAAKRS